MRVGEVRSDLFALMEGVGVRIRGLGGIHIIVAWGSGRCELSKRRLRRRRGVRNHP